MVRELQVAAPEVSKWSDAAASREVLYDFVFQGVALPDDFKAELLSASGLEWAYAQGEAPRSWGAAKASWDAYNLWRAEHPEVEDLSPGQRLGLYFSGGKNED